MLYHGGKEKVVHPKIVERIKRLLKEKKLSQRRIALEVGVSRCTVNAIAVGKRPDYESLRGSRVPIPGGPYVRCPSCGGKVQMPCVLCWMRSQNDEA
jgi:DNA-binding XRE family transcriptional regulator